MIDFSPVVREGLQAILTKDERIEVIGDAPDGHEALCILKRAYVKEVDRDSEQRTGWGSGEILRMNSEVAVWLTENLNDSCN
jgi:DNA-binding NarL/FixJ family response regulator